MQSYGHLFEGGFFQHDDQTASIIPLLWKFCCQSSDLSTLQSCFNRFDSVTVNHCIECLTINKLNKVLNPALVIFLAFLPIILLQYFRINQMIEKPSICHSITVTRQIDTWFQQIDNAVIRRWCYLIRLPHVFKDLSMLFE